MRFVWTLLAIALFFGIFKNLAHATAHFWVMSVEIVLAAFAISQIIRSSTDDEDDDD